MNIKSLLIAEEAHILEVVTCNKIEVLCKDGLPVNAVRFTASVGDPFTEKRSNSIDESTHQVTFENGDKILVKKSFGSDNVVYQFDGYKWIPDNTEYHVWKNNMESFAAYYPVEGGSNIMYEVNNDQSTLESITKCDRMFSVICRASKDQELNFVMERQTSRIIIKIASFNPIYPSGSKVENVQIIDQSNLNHVTGHLITTKEVYQPYQKGNGGVGTIYTLLADELMLCEFVRLRVGDKFLMSPILSVREIGMSYTYNLVVGKEILEIESVTEENWAHSEIIPGDFHY